MDENLKMTPATRHQACCYSENKLSYFWKLFLASPVSIPSRSCATHRPMRSSVEGLNQEIEKLVLVPGQQHTCRPESSHVIIVIIQN